MRTWKISGKFWFEIVTGVSTWKSATVAVEMDDDGIYEVECTDIPECISQGDTFEVAMANIVEAIRVMTTDEG